MKQSVVQILRSDVRLLGTVAGASTGEVVVFHYGPFAVGWRGLPILSPLLPLWARIWRRRVITVAHELAYDVRFRDVRGLVWAIWQRVALVPIVLASHAVVVATEVRRQSLVHSLIRPSKVIAVPVWAPFVSEALTPRTGATRETPLRIGVMGYGTDSSDAEGVIGAVASLRNEGIDLALVIVGAPGSTSEAGRRWATSAVKAGISGIVHFTDELDVEELLDSLRSLDIYVHADRAGPSARRTSLSTAFALGLPVVAIAGGETWPEAVAARALVVAEAGSQLEHALSALAGDPYARVEAGRRARAFYDRVCCVQKGVSTIRACAEPSA